MHIPAYAYATIQAALPTAPLPSQVPGANCCLCDMPFRGGVRVPLNAFTESDLEACRPCLTRLVAQARRLRDNAFTEETNRIRAELAEWKVTQDRHVASIERVRQAADAVTQLLDEDDIAPLRTAWLHVSLESAYAWVTEDNPAPPSTADPSDTSTREAEAGLFIAMTMARERIADRLAYHLISEASPLEPEMCAEFECPADCSGKHEISQIDCRPQQHHPEENGGTAP
jgi:hypothetical protein